MTEFLRTVDAALAGAAETPAGARLEVDLGAATTFDSAGVAALIEAASRARGRGLDLQLTGTSEALDDCLSLVSVERLTAPRPAPERIGWVRQLGRQVLPSLSGYRAALRLLLQCVGQLLVAPLRGRPPRLDRTVLELDAAGPGAVPITVLIAFLLGLVLSMQALVQLAQWSAELYLANMVGVAVVAEIGPLMTAIVLAARSASANAAQLGAMAVGEEIDALEQMGVDPQRFLVVPKVLALCVAAVALCLLFDLVALCGAAVFAWAAADTAPSVFLHQLRSALGGGAVLTALLKSGLFGFGIGVVGCAEGLRVTSGSAGVGRATTRAVVCSVFAVIVIDALFVVVQQAVRS